VSGAPPDPSTVAPAAFRALVGRWATGVCIVTSRDGSSDAGLTVNALLSVALDPPSVLVSLQREADTLPVLQRSRAFAVSVLTADQRPWSERFARALPAEEKFRDVPVHRGVTGAALLDGALAVLECRVVSITPAFDHLLVVGEVLRVEEGPDVAPLVFFRGAYSEAEGHDRLRLNRKIT
jgi:3-hydroxy-9,10-secoandrosta-1,3,5(10)-triene-9,17-dione monooxygenase reductase component